MRKSLTYKILAAVLALSAANWAVPANVLADEYIVKQDGEIISDDCDGVYGNGHSFTINGGTIDGDVFGVGDEDYDKDVSGGNVNFEGGTTTSGEAEGIDGSGYFVRGGYTKDGDTYNNTVSISGTAEVQGGVIGGQSRSGEAYYNTVNISGGSVEGYVFGGWLSSDQAHHNIVNISGGSVSSVYGGASSSGRAYYNTVNISGDAKVTGSVYGGDSTSAKAYNNTVNISGDAKVTGKIYGGYSSSGEAYNNTVNISGGSVEGNVYGGYIYI